MKTRLGSLVLLGLVTLSSTSASAHGGPPSALGLLAVNESGPEVILLNEGLALKRPEGWSYLCPSLWGEVDLSSGKFPLARSADGVETWVPGGEDLYLLRGQQLVAQQRPELRRNAMIALANDSKYVYGLHYTGIGERQSAEVVRLSTVLADPTFWRSDVYWSAISANEQGVYVARVVGANEVELVTLDAQGAERSRSTTMLPLTPWEMQLHALGERVYVTANDGTLWLIGYFEGGTWTEVVQDKQAIVGPQDSPDGTLWFAVGGVLTRLQGNAPEPTVETRLITCLEQWNDWRYACVGSDLHQLTDAGIGERVFGLDGFHAPDPKLVPPDAKDSCEQQWILYNIDATRSGLTFAAWPGGEAPAPGLGTAGSGAAAPSQAAGAAAAAGAGPAVVAGPAPASPSSGGCSVAAVRSQAGRGLFSLFFASVGLAWCARRARKTNTRAAR